jgi:transcriptional regulator with XRE-family HTH domain
VSFFLAENIRALRMAKGLKQHDIAKLANTTVVRISQVERAVVQPSVSILSAYTNSLQCSFEFLYARTERLQQFIKSVEQKTSDRNYDEDVERACFDMLDQCKWNTNELVLIYNILGKLYLNRGAYKKAYYYFTLIYDHKNNENGLAWRYINNFNLALTSYHLRRYDQAIFYLDELERFYSFHGNIADKYRVVHLRGSICIQQGNYEAAEWLFQDLLKYAIDHGKAYEEYSAIHNLGYNFLMQKKYQQAVSHMELAISKAYEANDSFKICEIAVDLSLCYIDMGDYPKAERMIEDALKLVKNNYVETRLRFNLARCKNDLHEKLTLLNEVCSKAEKMNYPVLLKDIYKQLGKTNSELGHFRESSYYFEHALKISESL